MRLPIQYALTYPDRRPSPAAPPDLIGTGRLEFRAPDEARFPALRIAREAGRMGARASAALIVADEVAVARFLARTLEFTGIPRLLEAAVVRFGSGSTVPGLDELVALDREIRAAYSTGPIGGAA
jgi:1-deoxy-D-xylulose-5-phosphate reductoisomerase